MPHVARCLLAESSQIPQYHPCHPRQRPPCVPDTTLTSAFRILFEFGIPAVRHRTLPTLQRNAARTHARAERGRLQPVELRHRADPAADRAAELVLVTFAARGADRCATNGPLAGARRRAHSSSRSVSLPSSAGSVPSRSFPHRCLPQHASDRIEASAALTTPRAAPRTTQRT